MPVLDEDRKRRIENYFSFVGRGSEYYADLSDLWNHDPVKIAAESAIVEAQNNEDVYSAYRRF